MFRCPLTIREDNMAANICAHNSRRHTRGLTQMAMNAGQHDSVQKNSIVLIQRPTLQHPSQENDISSGSSDESCSDIELDHDDDPEFADSACNPSMTYLNANTNKTQAEDQGAVAIRYNAERDDSSKWCEVEAQIRMNAVGISLSQSGMQVLLKADQDKKKNLTADTYVQLTAKRWSRNAGRKLKAKELMAPTSDQADSQGNYHRVCRKCSQDRAVCSKHKKRYEKQAVQGTSSQAMESSSLNRPPRKACKHSSKGRAQSKKRCASVHMALPAREEINRQTGSKKIMPKLDKFVSQETVIMNNNDCRRDLTDQNKKHNYQEVHLYKSDTHKRKNAETVGSNSQEKISKYTDSRGNRNSQEQLLLLHNGNYTSNNDDFIADETGSENRSHGTTMKMVTAPVTCQRDDSNQGRCVINSEHTCNATSTQTAKEPNDSQSIHRAMTKQVSPITVPYATDHSTAYEGVSMSDFIDYANNVRKNFKADYRNLDNLIKEFSAEMQERNKNHSSNSGSDEPKKDGKAKARRERCLIM